MAHFAKPAEGSWTEHYPELGTGPVSYEDSISPEHYELERDAIFRTTWLNVGRVEQLPQQGQLLHQGARRRPHLGHRRARHRRRGPRLPQHLPPPRQQAGVERLPRARRSSGTCRQFTCKYHGWRYDLDGAAHLRAAGVGVLRPRQGRLRARARAGRGVGGVHLREPRPRQHHVARASTSASSAPASRATRSAR